MKTSYKVFVRSLLKSIVVFVVFSLLALFASADCQVPDSKLLSQLQSRTNRVRIKDGVNIGDAIRVGIGTELVFRPSLDQKHHLRGEQVSLGLRLTPDQTVVESVEVGAGFDFTATAELIRQYDSFCDAVDIKANPPINTVTDIPFSAERARTALKPADYFRFQFNGAFVVKGSTLISSGISFIGIQAEVSYVLSGDFQIEVFKLSKDKVFVRVSSLNQKRISAGVEIDSLNRPFEIFAVNILDDLTWELLTTPKITITPFDLSYGSLLAREYTYDLSNPAGAEAYEQLINPATWSAERVHIINPVRDPRGNEVKKVIKQIFAASEELSRSHPEIVHLLSRTRTHFDRVGSSFDINLVLFKTDFERTLERQNFAVNSDPHSDDYERYRMATYREVSGDGMLFSLFTSDTRREANALFSVDKDDTITGFHELSFTHEFITNRYTRRSLVGRVTDTDIGDSKRLQNMLNRVFPESMHKNLPNNEDSPGVNLQGILDGYSGYSARFTMELRIRQTALQAVQALLPTEVEDVIDRFVLKLKLNPSKYGAVSGLRQVATGGGELNSSDAVKEIRDKLPVALRLGKTPAEFEKQWSQLLGLSNNEVFKSLMPGIMMRLLLEATKASKKSPYPFSHYFGYKLTISGKKREPQMFPGGAYERPADLDVIIRLRNRITDRAYDPEFFVTAEQ